MSPQEDHDEAVSRDKKKGMVSRRSFLKGLAVTGAGIAFLSSGLKLAKADPYAPFDPAANLSNDQLIEMQRKMLQIRWYERTVADRMLTQRGFRGYGHFACGQEAVAVGVCSALNKDDYIVGCHRSHHHAVAKGADLAKLAAEITFKATGTNQGYGGTMHLLQRDVGMLGEDGIVGPGGVLGAGAAFGIKARGTQQVAVTFGGDAHIASPYFPCALNNAMKFQLPFIYVIENNGYEVNAPFRGPAYMTTDRPWSAATYLESHAEIARGYHVPAAVIDGMNVLEVYNRMKEAVDRARAGQGPSLIEAKCYRYYDHLGASGSKAGVLGAFGLSYRPDSEVRSWLARDPIEIHRQTLIAMQVLTEDDANQLEADVKNEIAQAFAFADQSPVPNAEDGLKYVYRQGLVAPRQLPECPLYSDSYVA